MGYVVQDIEAAMQHWTRVLRIGPFYYAESAPIHENRYRGTASDVRASIALSDSNLDLFRMVKNEAQRWDGSGPIRQFENSKSWKTIT